MYVNPSGENIEPPIFATDKLAIIYMEDVIIPASIIKYERDDYSLDKNEIARWYELRPSQIMRNNKVTLSDSVLRRNGDYYRIWKENW